MAVFTPVSRPDLEHWLAGYDLGDLVLHEGIASGIENTNYFVDTSRGSYVLTLFERLEFSQLPFYLGLMHHLAARRIPCPDPVANRQGALFSTLHGKPAALVSRLRGSAQMSPSAAHCAQLGALLARMHLQAADYPGTLPNLRGLPWWTETAPQVAGFLPPAPAAMLADELARQQRFGASALCQLLPRSAVHADLFRDNVLFDGETLGGVIDFYFAGCDTWLFDLAVTCNDWCVDDLTGAFDDARCAAMLAAYVAVRAPQPCEREAWPLMLRGAALRFWLSRLFDLHLPRPAQMVTPKDPVHFQRVLTQRRVFTPPLPASH